jgi:hypothetical protein
MKATASSRGRSDIPKRSQKHHSYDESVCESEKLIEDEPVDIETETPAEDNAPIENADADNEAESPAFDE